MRSTLAIALLSLATLVRAEPPILPIAVWYGGAKVRAPMLDSDPSAHREGEYRLDNLEQPADLAQETPAGDAPAELTLKGTSVETGERVDRESLAPQAVVVIRQPATGNR